MVQIITLNQDFVMKNSYLQFRNSPKYPEKYYHTPHYTKMSFFNKISPQNEITSTTITVLLPTGWLAAGGLAGGEQKNIGGRARRGKLLC